MHLSKETTPTQSKLYDESSFFETSKMIFHLCGVMKIMLVRIDPLCCQQPLIFELMLPLYRK
jgi:hypothetical protein